MFHVQHLKISKFNFVFGPDFEFSGPNQRVDLIFKESGRPDATGRTQQFPWLACRHALGGPRFGHRQPGRGVRRAPEAHRLGTSHRRSQGLDTVRRPIASSPGTGSSPEVFPSHPSFLASGSAHSSRLPSRPLRARVVGGGQRRVLPRHTRRGPTQGKRKGRDALHGRRASGSPKSSVHARRATIQARRRTEENPRLVKCERGVSCWTSRRGTKTRRASPLQRPKKFSRPSVLCRSVPTKNLGRNRDTTHKGGAR